MVIKHSKWLLLVGAVLLATGCNLVISPERRIERAQESMKAGDYATAAIELRNAIDKAPANAKARLLLAEADLQIGDIDAARLELVRAKENGASAAQIAPLDARVKQTLGQWKELAADMAQPREGIAEARRLTYLGSAQLALGQPVEALATFDRALAAQPDADDKLAARTAHARALAVSGRSDDALAELGAVLKETPTAADAALLMASLQLGRGEAAQAEKVLAAVPLEVPTPDVSILTRASGLAALAEAQLAQQRLPEARKTAEALQKLLPGAPLTAVINGRIALAGGDGAAAITQFQKAVRGAPNFETARFWLALAYLKQGQAALAETELQRVVEANPANAEARKLLAQTQLQSGRARAALNSLEPAVKSGTADPGTFNLVAQAKVMEGDVAGAEDLWKQGLEAAPDNADVKLGVAAGYLSVGDRQRALDVLNTIPDDSGGTRKRRLQILALATGKDAEVTRMEIDALAKKYPDDVELQSLYGAWLTAKGDFGAAETALQAALKIAPNDGRALLAMSQLDARRGNPAGARQWLEEWRKRDPKAAEPRLRLAMIAFGAKDDATANKLINEALAAQPDVASVQSVAGRLLLQARQYDAALTRFRAAAAMEPQSKFHPFDMARAQLALGNRSAARESLNKSLSIDPNWAPAVAALAQLDVAEGKVDSALASADRLRRSGGNAALGLALEGDVQMAAKRYDKAAGAYAKAGDVQPSAALAMGEFRARRAAGTKPDYLPLQKWLQRQPGDNSVRFVLAGALADASDTAGAIREYERVVEKLPDNAVVLNNLAILYQQVGDRRAKATAAAAYAKAPDAGPIADTYGWILVQQGDVPQGLKLLQQAAEKSKDIAEIKYHLGVALAKAGKSDEARKALADSIAAAGQSPWKADAERELAALGTKQTG